MRPLILSGLLCSVLALPIWAEGNREVFACQIVTSCDEAGACEAGDAEVTFTFSPIETDHHGAGEYELEYQGIYTRATRIGWVGPTIWGIDTKTIDSMHTLMTAGESQMIWHQLNLTDPPSSETRFLECEDAI